jgi:hypothetical protein
MADFLKDIQTTAAAASEDQAWEKARPQRVAERRHLQAVEYRVEIVRSKIVGDRVDQGEVALMMNDVAAEGWRFTFALDTEVKARVGPGGMSGVMLFFERPGPAA